MPLRLSLAKSIRRGGAGLQEQPNRVGIPIADMAIKGRTRKVLVDRSDDGPKRP
jgi:hypothetical protein